MFLQGVKGLTILPTCIRDITAGPIQMVNLDNFFPVYN